MDLVHLTLIPDLGLGAHTASLGLTFYGQKMFPDKFHNGAFIGQHRSWNRSEFVGYKVVFVPLEKGKPTSAAEDFLTGFIASQGENDVEGARHPLRARLRSPRLVWRGVLHVRVEHGHRQRPADPLSSHLDDGCERRP